MGGRRRRRERCVALNPCHHIPLLPTLVALPPPGPAQVAGTELFGSYTLSVSLLDGRGEREGDASEVRQGLRVAQLRASALMDELDGAIARLRWDAEASLKACMRAVELGDQTVAEQHASKARAAVTRMPPGEILAVEQRDLEGRMRRLEGEIWEARNARDAEIARIEHDFAR